ncbi:VF530 family DNA-binding protein [Chryseobacterium sp. CH1]|uniref:VF530 family protein n=1 Tax=Chryseobacterium sp. CH1 TaxID=713551 RepID=UPI00100C0F5C|nr:VF530 family protein [Chryseobacterium sp. CH1]RXM62841.1 hypothetical protein BOQ60_18330 [Chryseobacterium sp. CH1]
MSESKDPLHGKRLDAILEELVEYYQGFEELGKQINIKCFTDNPSINSSLKFLRKTDWARAKVESLYLYVLRQKKETKPGIRSSSDGSWMNDIGSFCWSYNF